MAYPDPQEPPDPTPPPIPSPDPAPYFPGPVPRLLPAGARRADPLRHRRDAGAPGRPQPAGAGLAVRAHVPEQALQPQEAGRRPGLRLAGLQPVDGAAAGDDDEEDRVPARDGRLRGVAHGEDRGGRAAEVRAERGGRDIRSLAGDQARGSLLLVVRLSLVWPRSFDSMIERRLCSLGRQFGGELVLFFLTF